MPKGGNASRFRRHNYPLVGDLGQQCLACNASGEERRTEKSTLKAGGAVHTGEAGQFAGGVEAGDHAAILRHDARILIDHHAAHALARHGKELDGVERRFFELRGNREPILGVETTEILVHAAIQQLIEPLYSCGQCFGIDTYGFCQTRKGCG